MRDLIDSYVDRLTFGTFVELYRNLEMAARDVQVEDSEATEVDGKL